MARPDKISGADINSICQEVSWNFIYGCYLLKQWEIKTNVCSRTEYTYIRWKTTQLFYLYLPLLSQAGMLAVRENRYIVLAKDFEKAYKTVIKKDEQEHEFYK